MLESGEGGWIGWGWTADSYKKQRQALLLFPWTSITAMCVMVKGTALKQGGALPGADRSQQMSSSDEILTWLLPGHISCRFFKWEADYLFLVLWKLFLGCLFPFSSGMLLPWLQQLSDRCHQRSGPVLNQMCHLWLVICHKVDLAEMCFVFLSRVLSYKKAVESLFPWFSFLYADGSPEGSHFAFMWSEVTVVMSCLEELQSIVAFWAFVKTVLFPTGIS